VDARSRSSRLAQRKAFDAISTPSPRARRLRNARATPSPIQMEAA
jgi:hypothetical protein